MQAGAKGLSARLYVAALCVLPACILFVPSRQASGRHCAFNGIDSACGQCLANTCIQSVDSCCLDDECGGVIADLEACATQPQDGEACARLANPDDRDGKHRELSACVTAQCAAACGVATNITRCRPPYTTSVEACSCEIDSTPNDTPCTEIGHPKLRCCAPEGWPGPVLACECLTIICVPVSDDCVCELSSMDNNGRASECSGQYCCADDTSNQCRCGSTACYGGEHAVPSCTIDQLGCNNGRTHVDACSVPKP